MATHCGPVLSGWVMLQFSITCAEGRHCPVFPGNQPFWENTKSSKLWFFLFSLHSPSSLLTDSCWWTLHTVFWELGVSIIPGSLWCQREIFKVQHSKLSREFSGDFLSGYFLFWLWQHGAKTKALNPGLCVHRCMCVFLCIHTLWNTFINIYCDIITGGEKDAKYENISP